MTERLKVTDVLTRDEIAHLTRASDLGGARAVLVRWAIIGATFFALASFPHPLVYAVAIVLLGAQQLALAVLMHEAAHRSLFRTRWLNDTLTDWLCARPVWGDVSRYRKHHVAHHAHTGTERDPDRNLAEPFPITRGSLARKFARDLLFVSGARRVVGLGLMDALVLEYNVSGDAVKKLDGPRTVWGRLAALSRNASGVALTNGIVLGVLWLAGHPAVYLAWAAAWLTTYGLFLRIRSFSEHARTDRTENPFRNTRTTRAGLLARLTVAPLNVNYHLEHHLLVAVPFYRLPAMHRLLRERGALDGAMVSPGYADVLRTITST